MRSSGPIVPGELEQVGRNGIQSMMAGKPAIDFERVEQLEACRRTMHHRRRDRVIER